MEEKVLPLLKARLGISTDSRNILLNAIIRGIVSECEEVHGVILSEERDDDIMFVMDWATWKYQHPEDGVTPRSIQFRLKNMIVQNAAGGV